MELKVDITYKRIKNLHLRVKDGIVKVSSPMMVSKQRIMKFVNDNLDFINKQLNRQEIIKEKNDIKINDEIVVLNKKYIVLSTSLKAKHSDHYIFVKENIDIKKQIKKLFKSELEVIMKEKTLKYFTLMNLNCSFPNLAIKDVKSKWGSYSKRKHEIIYSSNIIFKDESVYDYLVVHELAHILQYNHSKEFYNIVSKYCPNYKVLRKKLKEV